MWDLDKRTWNFYVELILGDQLYLKVYDTVAASSWVTVNFPPVRAKGIRIFNRKGSGTKHRLVKACNRYINTDSLNVYACN